MLSQAWSSVKQQDASQRLMQIVRETQADLSQGAGPLAEAHPHSSLQRELGLDSLGRIELLLRVERGFGQRLPEGALGRVETPLDILRLLEQGAGVEAPLDPSVRQSPAPGGGAAPAAPQQAASLLEVLDWHVARHGARTQVIVLEQQAERHIGYARLREQAGRVAGWLQAAGIAPGQPVALMLPTAEAYFFVYFGVLLAGCVPVPVYPPASTRNIEDHLRRHAAILDNAQAAVLITVPEALAAARLLQAVVPCLRQVADAAACLRHPVSAQSATARAEDLALIQYTSGSTGTPKGVMLSHANLLANIRAIGEVVDVRDDDVFVSWLPLYHDMGLIAAWLCSLYFGNPLVVMPPQRFLQRPAHWLWAMHRFRGTLTAAPNFGYEFCLRHVQAAELAGLDLSALRVAACGAEAVSADTMQRFAAHFAQYGLDPGALTPVYGLAESSVGLLVPPLGRGVRVDCIDRQVFSARHHAVAVSQQDPAALRFVSCGRALPGHAARIVDAQGGQVGERVEGRLEFRGPSATRGYWRNPERSRELMRDGWLDTGDLAYAAEAEIYVTGRIKDLIIRAGRHVYPEDVEQAVGEVPGVRRGRVVAFGRRDAQSGTESLVVLAETQVRDRAARDALRRRIAQRVSELLGEPADSVVLAPAGTVLKTSSGKLRRAATAELLKSGRLARSGRRAGWALLRLGGRAAGMRLRHGVGSAVDWLWGVYVLGVLALAAPWVWLLTVASRDWRRAWSLNHQAAVWFLRLAGLPWRVEGEGFGRGDGARIVVANHASYLDPALLLAALSAPHRFVAKRELERSPIARVYLRSLGVMFVDRDDAARGVADAARLAERAAAGDRLCVFPEGTFRRTPGLLPFRLGPFAVAAQAGVPLYAVAIRGSRDVLPDGNWLPRRCPVVLHGDALQGISPTRDAAAAALLRGRARSLILRFGGEPDALAVQVETAPARAVEGS